MSDSTEENDGGLDLMLDLGPDGGNVWVPSSYPSFAGTGYEQANFELFIKPMTRTVFTRSVRKNTTLKKGAEVTDNAAVQTELFHYALRDWKGIKSNGVALPCNDDNKKKIAESKMTLVNIVVELSLAAESGVLAKKETEAKNS